jgi:hypothetical protein
VKLRWVGSAALVAVVLPLAVSASAAPTRVRLNGRTATHVSFSGQLSGASGAAPFGLGVNGQPVGSCQPPSCDAVTLHLDLPRATSLGHLKITAGTNETNTGLVLRLFDGQGQQLAVADHGGGAIGVDTDPSQPNQFYFLNYDLHRGQYVLWIQDTGGAAPYNADVYWTLHH